MSPRVAVAALIALAAAAPSGAQTFSGNATALAEGATTQYVTLGGLESTTGPLSANGTCSNGSAQSWLSASSGALALRAACDGSPSPNCVPNSYGNGNSAYSGSFVVQSATLPAGTLVDVSLCVKAAIRHGIRFGCGGSVFEGVTSVASAEISIVQGTSPALVARGGYSERWNCFDGHSVTETGLFAAGAGETTLTAAQVPVGSVMTVSASLTCATSEQSFFGQDAGRIEMAVVFGYSASGDVRLVSLGSGTELSPLSNCSLANLDHWLPPATGTVSVESAIDGPRAVLLPPTPQPARGATRLAFSIPRDGPVELTVCDVGGACVARVTSGWRRAGRHELTWEPRDRRDRALAPGHYWLRLVTPEGRTTRSLLVVR